jgi:hypothetical protein
MVFWPMGDFLLQTCFQFGGADDLGMSPSALGWFDWIARGRFNEQQI